VNVTIGGRSYADVRMSGDLARLIADAQQYRSTVVQRAQREAESFRAKLAQYRANPGVFLTGALASALNAFLGMPTIEQVFWIPRTDEPVDLRITPDPAVARQRERERYSKDVEGNQRVQEMREGQGIPAE
jgi:hypothetical protein